MTTAEWRLAVAIVTIPTLPPERFPKENRHYFVFCKNANFPVIRERSLRIRMYTF